MRNLSKNEVKFVSGGDGNDGQAELIAIGALAGTFINPGAGSIIGAYLGDKVHSWATTSTVNSSMSPSGLGGHLGSGGIGGFGGPSGGPGSSGSASSAASSGS